MKNTWLHVHDAALLGLPAALRGDQALVHGLTLKQQSRKHDEQKGTGKDHHKIPAEPVACVFARTCQMHGKNSAHRQQSSPVSDLVHCLGLLPNAKGNTDGDGGKYVVTKLHREVAHHQAQDVDGEEKKSRQHGSGLLLVSGAALWLFLPLAGGKNAVSDSVRELVRPLPYRLISNANCLGGGGDGATQQFNGLCFLHSHIEP